MSISTRILSDEEKLKFAPDCNLDNFKSKYWDPAPGTEDELLNKDIRTARYCCLRLESRDGRVKFPVYNPVILSTITKILFIICVRCGNRPRLALKEPPITKFPKDLSTAKKRSNFKCPTCDSLPSIEIITASSIRLTDSKSIIIKRNGNIIANSEILFIFNNIKDTDLKYLGLTRQTHPRNLFTTILIFPPKLYYDNLGLSTERNKLIGNNNRITGGISELYGMLRETNRRVVEKDFQDIYTAIIGTVGDKKSITARTLFDGKNSAIPELQTLTIVNMGRCVINAGAHLPYNYVMIPRRIAEGIMISINVTDNNIESVRRLNKLGFINSATHKGNRVSLDDSNNILKGQVVRRQVMTGDVILINRAPTLSLNSILGVRIIVHNGIDMKLNLELTHAFNADFDGDEMNIIGVVSQEAATELWTLFHVYNTPIDGGKSQGNVKFVLNTCLGFLRILEDRFPITTRIWRNITQKLFELGPSSSLFARWESVAKIPMIDKSKRISGKLLLSTILPEKFNFNNDYIHIVNGIVIKFEKETQRGGWADIPGLVNSMAMAIMCHFSNEIRHRFLINMTRLAHAYLDNFPVSINYSDFIVTTGVTTRKATANIQSGLLEFISHKIKGKLFNLKNLVGQIPIINSNLNLWPNQQGPFYQRGEAIGNYVNGSNFLHGQSWLEMFMMSGGTRKDIIDSKGNVARFGHTGNLTRAALAGIQTDSSGVIRYNGIALGPGLIQWFNLHSLNKGFGYLPIGKEFASPSISNIEDANIDADDNDLTSLDNEDNEPESHIGDDFDN